MQGIQGGENSLIKCIIFFAIFYILAFAAGSWGNVLMTKTGSAASAFFRIAFGGCVVTAVSLLACLAGGIAGASATTCAVIAAVLIAVLIISGIISVRIMAADGTAGIGKDDIPMVVVTVAAIAAQVWAVMYFRYDNSLALRGIDTATRIFEGAKLSVSDPMMSLIGVMASILHMHPLKVVFTVLPPVMIALYNICYAALICTLCTDWKRITAFCVIVLLNLWGYQSDVLIPATLLISWFGIWVFVVHGILNVFAAVMIRYLENLPQTPDENETEDTDEDILEEWDMKKHRIINARNLAIALGVLAAVLLAAVVVLNSKINRLYDATVNLQTDMNSRCSIYEFVPDDGNAAGYLIKGSDGTVTFVGGGPASNADALGEFFDRYGNTVTDWYVYGSDEENCGAMNELIDSARVNVTKIFVIERKEME